MQLTQADTLSILIEIRRRLSDPANWGGHAESMKVAPHCVLGHAVDIAGLEKTDEYGAGAYHHFHPSLGGPLESVARILAAASIHPASSDPVGASYETNDDLHFAKDHRGLLAWLDRALAKAEAELGMFEVAAIDQPVPLRSLKPTIGVSR